MFDESSEKYYTSDIPRIDPKFKNFWVAALRSGLYEQGQQVLKTQDGKFCCLGVACDLKKVPVHLKDARSSAMTALLGGLSEKIFVYGNEGDYRFDIGASTTAIPRGYGLPFVDVGDLFGDQYLGSETVFELVPRDAEYPDELHNINLPMLNDSGYTFDQIADVINYFL